MTVHSILYLMGVYPLAFAYVSGICLLFPPAFRFTRVPVVCRSGRMALTNYIGQSVAGMFVFYGIGLGLGSEISLFITELIVVLCYSHSAVYGSFFSVLAHWNGYGEC